MLSRGAERCLEVLRWYAARFRRVFVFQRTLAQILGRTLRQVQRYIHELKAAGAIVVQMGGPSSASYRVAPVENIVVNQSVKSKNVVAMSQHHLSTESMYRKPAAAAPVSSAEENCEPPRRKPAMPDWRELIPPRSVVNEMGRHVPNDAFYRVRDALERADSRIRRARSPDAYRVAIIRGELKEARCG